jgi:hypothetical protein
MKKMITLYADEGKVLTNGEVYGTTISLAEGIDGSEFYEITEAEYETILNEQMQKEM